MNLYRVTAASLTVGRETTYDVFVLAEDTATAEKKALAALRKAEYPYTDYVKCVALVAAKDRHRAGMWLIG